MLGLVTSVVALSQHLSGYELEREMPFFGPAKARVDVPYGLGETVRSRTLRNGVRRRVMQCWMPCWPRLLILLIINWR